jgi:hypothetical protein
VYKNVNDNLELVANGDPKTQERSKGKEARVARQREAIRREVQRQRRKDQGKRREAQRKGREDPRERGEVEGERSTTQQHGRGVSKRMEVGPTIYRFVNRGEVFTLS